ncbi:hypothetical protein D5366_10450 [Neokomagataea tanensis]|uniref:Uncharacterized protein n=2 Tax=Neokomagataea TaxID=1223423 RepID=A0A4Y6VAL8_9PROT|nr:hypothetical protein D5366_10450 [Neokomagataea tanensis]
MYELKFPIPFKDVFHLKNQNFLLSLKYNNIFNYLKTEKISFEYSIDYQVYPFECNVFIKYPSCHRRLFSQKDLENLFKKNKLDNFIETL